MDGGLRGGRRALHRVPDLRRSSSSRSRSAGIGATTLAVALAPYQALFIAVSIPLLLAMPFFFAMRVRKAGRLSARRRRDVRKTVGRARTRPFLRWKPLNGERKARENEAFSLSMRDYVALTKPKILWLLLLVALASAVIAARAIPARHHACRTCSSQGRSPRWARWP